jgi:pyrroline-5-carboxylate reductase
MRLPVSDIYISARVATNPIKAPGGCTIAGLLTLEDGRVRSTIARAIQVATERASVLGQPTKKA